MSSVSNSPFEELELQSWSQVHEVAGSALISYSQVEAKKAELAQASNYTYSDADVTRRVQEERKYAAQAGKPAVLTTRQKLLAQHGGEARPKKFQRDVLGRALVADNEG